jgi:hypothetical protein
MRKRKGLKAQMRAWNAATREIRAAAEAAKWFKLYGLRFRITAEFPESAVDQANAWMEANPGHGVIGVRSGRIYIANCADKGRP